MPPAVRSPAAARLFYAVIVFCATLVGLRLDPSVGAAVGRLARAFHPPLSARDVVDGVRNLALFAGLGATWVVTAHDRRWRDAIGPATVVGLALSALVESVQLFSPVRTASVLDLATNTGGAFGGAVLTAAAMRLLADERGEKSYVGVPAAALALPYLGAALVEAFAPLFRHALAPGAWGGPARRWAAAVAVTQGASLGFPLIDLVLFVPAGFLVTAMLAEWGLGLGLAAACATLGGAALAGFAQLARGVTGARMEPGAWVMHLAGLAAGAALAWRALPAATRRLRGAARPRLLLALYALILVAWAWRPFRLDLSAPTLSAELAAEHWVPLYALGERGDLFSVADVAVQFLLYFPLGALLAVWPVRRSGFWRDAGPALLLALVLEGGQFAIAGRYFDVTDWMIQAAGALVGWAVVRRAGFRPYGDLLGPPAAAAVADADPARRRRVS